MTDKDTPASANTGPLLGLGSSDGLGLVPERDDYSQAVWECFCDMPKDGQKLRMLDVLMFGQACADKARAAELERCERLRAELRRVQEYIDETPELFEALGPLDHGA